MAWQTAKTNWKKSDYYNYGDLNRVENNTQEVANIMDTYSEAPNLNAVITNRGHTSIEFYDSFNRIENNIKRLKDSLYEPVGWMGTKTDWTSVGESFDHNHANRLETNLLLLYELVNNTKNYLPYCGAFYAGQDNTYL